MSATLPHLPAASCILAADIGGTKTATAWVDGLGRVHARAAEPSRAKDGAGAVLAIAADGLRRARADALASGFTPVAVGVGTAGVVADGVITAATDAITGWVGAEVAGEISAALELPTAVINDVHAHGLGEALYGAGAGHGSVLVVAVGTGIGGALVDGGVVMTGAHRAAGHIGHLSAPAAADLPCSCGRTGHLEGLASGTGILARYRGVGGGAVSTHEVFTRAAAGEVLAASVITEVGEATGRAIGDLVNILDPDLVAVGGGVAETGEIWWQPVRDGFAASAMDLMRQVPVVPALLGGDAALIGAAHHAATLIGKE